eukprot:97621_1
MSATNSTPHWNALQQNINFHPPTQNDYSFFSNMLQYLQPIASVQGSAFNNHYHSNAITSSGGNKHVSCPSQTISRTALQQVVSLLSVCHYNKTDLAELLITQYQRSHLSTHDFMSRCALFDELSLLCKHSNKTSEVQDMLCSYIQLHNAYIASPLQCIDRSTFTPFNDHIDIVLSYLLRINQCVDEYMVKSRPTLFDVYFVPPTAPNDLDFVDIKGMVQSAPRDRCHRQSTCGLDDVYSLFLSEKAHKMLSTQSSTKRYVLVIVRKNEDNTNEDKLYLMEHQLKYDLRSDVFSNNEMLWHILSKKDIVCSKYQRLNVDDAKYGMFNVSYHLRGGGMSRIYEYYNGFGSRIMTNDIVNMNQWQPLFVSGKNKISNSIKREFLDPNNGFNDFLQSDLSYKYGEYLFGLRYYCTRHPVNKRRILHFPKDVLKNDVPDIREFDEPQKQLYYFLSWTMKMQVIDGEFMEYTFNTSSSSGTPRHIAIFNAELHERYSNDSLYVIAVLNDETDASNKPCTWRMDGMMTYHQIYDTFGIEFHDLPVGSRHIHHQFEKAIGEHNIQLHSNFIAVSNWKRVDCIHSQKYSNGRPNLKGFDLNSAIKVSVDAIRSQKGCVSLIPILNVDMEQKEIKCDALIPIKIPNRSSYIAVAYRVNHKNKNVVTGLYIDVLDIIKKAALIDPCAYETYEWLHGEDAVVINPRGGNRLSLSNVDSALSVQSVPSVISQSTVPPLRLHANDSGDSARTQPRECAVPLFEDVPSASDSWHIQSLQKQLNDALEREQLLWKMLQQKTDNMLYPQRVAMASPTPTPKIITAIHIPSLNMPATATPVQVPMPTIRVPTVNNISNMYFNQNYSMVSQYSPPTFPLTGVHGVTLPQTPESNLAFALTQTQGNNGNQLKQ